MQCDTFSAFSAGCLGHVAVTHSAQEVTHSAQEVTHSAQEDVKG